MDKEKIKEKAKEMERERTKRVLDEIEKTKNKTTPDDENVVEQKISLYQKLNKQLMDMTTNHSETLKQIRSQPMDAVEKLVEQLKS
jgi:predicted patatin/cPLA2 family phospholipase